MGSCCSCRCICGSRTRKKIVLLLVGLDNAGKTTALKGLAGESTDHVIPSIGFSTNTLQYKNFDVQVYDLGGGRNIRGIWTKYFPYVHGVIFVVDASNVDRLEECREELERLLQSQKLAGKPVLVLANKQDLPGALDELDLVERLGLEILVNTQKCPTSVETCAAVLSPDPAVQSGYRWLMECITRNLSQLEGRVQADVEEQHHEEQKIKEQRRERVNKLREERLAAADNGHTLEQKEEDFNSNPFRPISELTSVGRATSGTKMIMVQESPSKHKEQEHKEKENGCKETAIEPQPFTSPFVNHLVRDGSAEQSKKKGMFSLRSNKTAPMCDTSPVRKAVLPPLAQTTLAAEAVPWMKPVLSSAERRATPGQSDGAWGLEDALEPVIPLPEANITNSHGTRLTQLSRPTLDNGL